MISAKDNTGKQDVQQAPTDPAALEQAVLRSLFQAASFPEPLVERLARYQFGEPLRQVIFEELRGSCATSRGLTRTELQSRLTRRGFPDVDLAPYYDLPALPGPELEDAVNQLLDLD